MLVIDSPSEQSDPSPLPDTPQASVLGMVPSFTSKDSTEQPEQKKPMNKSERKFLEAMAALGVDPTKDDDLPLSTPQKKTDPLMNDE